MFFAKAHSATAFNPADLWKNVRTYQANFTQNVDSKTMPGSTEETKGVLYLMRPDKLRWEITPEKAEPEIQILSNNELQYIRKNRRGTTLVDIYGNVNKAPSAKPLLFLMGKMNLTSIYRVKILKESQEVITMELKPKTKGSQETYIAEIDKKGYFLLSLITETPESKVSIRFSEPKLNIGLSDSLFDYRPKAGDVVHRQ